MHIHNIGLLFIFHMGFPLVSCDRIDMQSDNILFAEKDKQISTINTVLEESILAHAIIPNTEHIYAVKHERTLLKTGGRSRSGRSSSGRSSSGSKSTTSTSRKSWGERLSESVWNMVVGVIIFLLAFPIVTLSEGLYLHRCKVLRLAGEIVTPMGSTDDEKIAINVEERKEKGLFTKQSVVPAVPLFHTSGSLTIPPNTQIIDERFNIGTTEKAFLHRKVEMYQYYEESTTSTNKDMIGGGEETETTYYLEKKWSEDQLPNPTHHNETNPSFPEYSSSYMFATGLNINSAKISESQQDKLKTLATTNQVDLSDVIITEELGQFKKNDDYFYSSKSQEDNTDTNVGDIRISWYRADLEIYSVMCGKNEDTFSPYDLDAFGTYKIPYLCCGCCPGPIGWIIKLINGCSEDANVVNLMEKGTLTSEEMLSNARQSSKWVRSILRVGGFLMFWFGCYLILDPIAVFADLIGFIGSILRFSIVIATFIFGLVMYILTVAFAWFYYRPLVTFGLITSSAIIVVGVYQVSLMYQ